MNYFFYLILFFLVSCTTIIDATNYDDFRRQSLLKGFYYSAEAKSDNIRHLYDRGAYGAGNTQLRANQIAIEFCIKAGFRDCIITKENDKVIRLTQWQQAEAKALELKNAEAKALELKNTKLPTDNSSQYKKGLKNNWKRISRTINDDTHFYVDTSSIKTEKYYKYYWVLADYLKKDGDKVRSVITYNKVDCGDFKFQLLKMIMYDGQKGEGKKLDEFDIKNPEWTTMDEKKTAGDILLSYVCKS
ncbi:surface-adhesin E family protein [Candidatus Fonsibacter ubiquis]|uniref:surface-adhesin E family protein n=1 Tax=Candidatus Fonsibacter ubiquis TaxID=1925548 RepID=UPI000C086051|nr:surface-adhesin E family protein [Candidatus Fonsibacter ubiquis]